MTDNHPLPSSIHARDIDVLLRSMRQAGETVADLYARAAAVTYEKADGSPVTDADLASDAIIRAVLAESCPDDAILTEEGADDRARLASPRCWIVDPIDGTQEFVDRTDDFDVLMALSVNGRPVVAGSLQPTTGVACLAVAGEGAWVDDGAGWRRVRFEPSGSAPRLGTSRWFGAPENLQTLGLIGERLGWPVASTTRIGLTPRQFLEPRAADVLLGFRLGAGQFMAHEWDAVSADLFLAEAGGAMTDLHGRISRYNRDTPHLEDGLVVAVAPDLHARALFAVRGALAEAGVTGFAAG